MDAYDIKNKITELWQRLSSMPNAGEVKKQFVSLPVYVEVNGKVYQVTNVKESDLKIVLETDNVK